MTKSNRCGVVEQSSLVQYLNCPSPLVACLATSPILVVDENAEIWDKVLTDADEEDRCLAIGTKS